jgi:hypothetical protein
MARGSQPLARGAQDAGAHGWGAQIDGRGRGPGEYCETANARGNYPRNTVLCDNTISGPNQSIIDAPAGQPSSLISCP